MISGYRGDDKTADHAFAEFADRYADLSVGDHAAHDVAIKSGRVPAVDGT